ncbi:pectin acetylesterase-family hydrolase [Pseudohalioglobus lutimaris]|uniref:VtpJ-therm n=1 Tax=Pseudohalioglobus lutimaris TaxID=1737061 RepID=A0A2N5X6Q5_9GAMM|nr:pectin acetylesterase-family hydrolase [Pseudohalioglobus lutimaris]PLW70173.1 vtpJ-therm [Pseudohalioglobus lutimaris]
MKKNHALNSHRPLHGRGLFVASLLSLGLLAGCSDSSDRPRQPPEPEPLPFQELFDQGINRYIGEYTPMLSEENPDNSSILDHTFGAGDGPLCLDGSEYVMSTLDAGSEDLLIFLEGGGACWSELCAATPNADPGIPQSGILDPDRQDNPVKDYNVAYFNYCDGGIFGSDIDYDTDGDGQADRFQRGLHNLSAGLDVTLTNFPNPRRIVLMGSSAGGLGTTQALPLVRFQYPGVRIDVVNDAGVGVARPDQPEYLELLFDDWNSRAFIPESCPECIAEDGHLSDYHVWQMDQDPDVRRGMLSHSDDPTFALAFLMIGFDAWKEALYPEMQQLEDAHPERSKYWIPVGVGHTFLQAEPDRTAGGVPLMEWISLMLDDSPDWQSEQD